ncbi:hypothetical protein ACFE04_013370 [Oxalis oulophora]
MRILSIRQGALLVCFLVSLLTAAAIADENLVQVVGAGQCQDCVASNIKTTHAFSGIRVTIVCKGENGELATQGEGELDEQGKFKVSLPYNFVKDSKLKEKCSTQLSSASGKPCVASDGLKIKTSDNQQIFELTEKLKFSSQVCTSKFFWHHKHSPFPKLPPFPKYSHPKFTFPPLPPKHFPHIHKKPPTPTPVYKKPCPPTPIYKKPLPPVPVLKPLPPIPKVPIFHKPLPPIPKIPIHKPLPPIPKIPIHKPLPPIPKIPIHKPLPPIPKIPIHKPLPPFPKISIPPFTKKPCPPLPKLPPIPKIPPFHHHHKFGKWPPLPPFAPIHP